MYYMCIFIVLYLYYICIFIISLLYRMASDGLLDFIVKIVINELFQYSNDSARSFKILDN